MTYIVKTLSTKKDKNGFSQVLFAIRIGSDKRIRTQSGIFVPVQNWNEKKKELTIPRALDPEQIRELKTLKEKISDAEKRTLKLIDIFGGDSTKGLIEEMMEILKDVPGTITADIVHDVLKKREEDINEEPSMKVSVFDYCDKFLNKGYSDSKARCLKVMFRTMSRYEVYRNEIVKKPFTWIIKEIKQKDIVDFFEYIANEHIYRIKYPEAFEKATIVFPEDNRRKHKKLCIEQRGENTIVTMKKGAKAFWNWLIKTNQTNNNPFLGVEIGREVYGTPYYMNKEERDIVANYDFSNNKHLETQRDIFIFQCLIGCRINDMMHLTQDNVVNGILIYKPHKTKDESKAFNARVPLSQQALALIDKYKDVDGQGRIMPFISEQKYNDAIKKILETCKINRKVPVRNPKTGEDEMKPLYEVASSHMARRTFVGNAYKVVQDPNLIGRMSGHVEGSKAFVRYRDIDDSILEDVINKFQ